MTAEDAALLVRSLPHEPFAPVRRLVLELFHKYAPEKSLAILEEFLSDRHGAVRETARFLLKQHTNRDYAAFYREKLLAGEAGIGVIAGLGETGTAADADYVVPFLDHERSSIVRVAIRALANLDFATYKEIFITLLTDVRAGAVKDARTVLTARINTVDAKEIYEIFTESTCHMYANTQQPYCSH